MFFKDMVTTDTLQVHVISTAAHPLVSCRLAHDHRYFEFLPAAGLGLEDVRLLKAVFADDSLQAKVTVVANRESTSRPELCLLSHRIEVFK